MIKAKTSLNCIALICRKAIWNKLAKRCVATRRIDIAIACFSHIQDARGALAIQKIQEAEPNQLDLHLARLALHLGMNVSILLPCAV